MNHNSIPWNQVNISELSHIEGVCLDIDDTLSSHGKLTAEAYQSLWDLYNSGFKIVPLTGRPAGWCDHIVRFWPVHAVVGENGAFIYEIKNGKRQTLIPPCEISLAEAKIKRDQLAEIIKKRFPHAKWASDQAFRERDLAIDYCEDVPKWSYSDVNELLFLCESNGAEAKLSSIHVNTWYGKFDKISTFRFFLENSFTETSPLKNLNQWIFIGDSPNDQPNFQAFKYSVGVANVMDFTSLLSHFPRWVCEQRSGEGFSEMAKTLINMKRAKNDG